MITFFDEDDLVSFGNFMISEERKQTILQADVTEEVKQDALSGVTPFDYSNWLQLRQMEQQLQFEEEEEDEGYIIDDEEVINEELN